MTKFDKSYNELVRDIIVNGHFENEYTARGRWEDGTPAVAKSVLGRKLIVGENEVPVVTTKKFFSKSAVKEMFVFWVHKSNKAEMFKHYNLKIWDKWIINDPLSKWHNTIGPSYGYQLGIRCKKFPLNKVKFEHLDPEIEYERDGEYILLDQVDYLIQTLLTTPDSRRNVTSLWNIEDLDEMALPPCVWKTNWCYSGGKLNLIVGIRSNDIALGNPFNAYQYYVLHRMICQVTNLTPGFIQFDIDDAHIYDRHIPVITEQIIQETQEVEFWINPDVKNFYKFNPDTDFKLTYMKSKDIIKKFDYELSE